MSQDLRNQFLQAEANVNEGKVLVPETLRMKLYGLAKQAKEGDCKMPQPPSSNIILKSKWDNWMGCAGMTMEKAMDEYAQLVSKLEPTARMDRQTSSKRMSVVEGPSKKGILYKQRDVFKGWRPRHFVLQDNFLHYYLEADDPAPRNTLDLTGCSVTTSKAVIVDGVEYFPFTISHPKSKQAYSLSTDSKLEADIWVAKIIDAANLPPSQIKEPASPMRDDTATDSNVSTASTYVQPADGFFLEGTAYPNDTRVDTPPALLQKIERLSQEMLQSAPIDAPGWEPLWVKDGLTAKKKVSGNLIWVKAEILLPYCLLDVFQYITDIQNQRPLDPGRLIHERFKSFSKHTWVDYIRYKGLWPTSPRDFVNVAHWRMLQDGRVLLIGFGEKFDDQRPPVEGHVRGEMHLGGYLLTQTAEGTVLHYVVKLDLKGTIPGTIVNLVSNSQPMILLTLKHLMNKAKQRGSVNRPIEYRTSYSEIVNYMSDELYKSCTDDAAGGAAAAANGGGNSPVAASGSAKLSSTVSSGASSTASHSASAGGSRGPRGSTLLKQAARIPHINNVALLILFLPPLLYYVLQGTKWRAAGFLAGLLIALNYLLHLHLGRASNKSSPQLKYQVAGAQLLFRFPIELTQIVQYIEAKRSASEVDVTFSHIAVKAAATAVHEQPSLNGHLVFETFYRNKTPAVDVSVSLDVTEGHSVMMKVTDADAKPTEFIADEVIKHAQALRSGEAQRVNPIVSRLQGILPTVLGSPIRQQLYRLGALYGVSIPSLGIEPFPQGVVAVVSSPAADSAVDLDFNVVPHEEASSAPITITMGGLRVMPLVDEGGHSAASHGHGGGNPAHKKILGTRVLNFSIAINSRAVSLAEARKFAARFQQLMNDPSLLDKLHEKAEFDRVEAAKRKSAFGSHK